MYPPKKMRTAEGTVEILREKLKLANQVIHIYPTPYGYKNRRQVSISMKTVSTYFYPILTSASSAKNVLKIL